MSYILDALKKSDQERQRGAAPTLRTAQATIARRERSGFWIYGLLALVLIGAGVAIGWLHPWQPDKPVAAAEALVAKPVIEPVASKSLEPNVSANLPISAPASAPAPTRTNAPRPAAVPEVAKTVEPALPKSDQKLAPAVLPVAPPVGESLPATMAQPAPVVPQIEALKDALAGKAPPVGSPAALPARPAAPGENALADKARAKVAREEKTPRWAELPPAIRQEIPKLSISVHFYSNKRESSLVSINGRSLHEGEEAAPDLKLEQITPDGVIFDYKGHRFYDSVQR